MGDAQHAKHRTDRQPQEASLDAGTGSGRLDYVTWQTDEPIRLPIGKVIAFGDASVQVRRPERVVLLGDLDVQTAAVQSVIVQALAAVLASMEPTTGQLTAWRDEIASATLVAANTRLSALGAVLLDLAIDEMSPVQD